MRIYTKVPFTLVVLVVLFICCYLYFNGYDFKYIIDYFIHQEVLCYLLCYYLI